MVVVAQVYDGQHQLSALPVQRREDPDQEVFDCGMEYSMGLRLGDDSSSAGGGFSTDSGQHL